MRGDGLGYDVRSFASPDRELFIEVKTAASDDRQQPFFLRTNELAFFQKRAVQYNPYRVCHFSRQPRLFQLDGPDDRHTHRRQRRSKAAARNQLPGRGAESAAADKPMYKLRA